VGPVNADDATT